MSSSAFNIEELEKSQKNYMNVRDELQEAELSLTKQLKKLSGQRGYGIDSIKSNINTLSKSIDYICYQTSNVASVLAKIIDKVNEADRSAAKIIYSGNVSETVNNDTLNWREKVKEAIKDFSSNFKNGLSIITDATKTAANWVSNDYKNKGMTWKIHKTVSAAVKIVSAVVVAAGAWGMTVGSVGLSAPFAAIVTLNETNTIANSLYDLKNIWNGNVDEVGTVNILKTDMSYVIGLMGKAIGGEDGERIGQTVGNVLYAGGAIVSTAVSLGVALDKIKQIPSISKSISGSVSEIKPVIKGLWSIAKDSDISNMSYDYALLKQTIPNLVEMAKSTSVILEFVNATDNFSTDAAAIITAAHGIDKPVSSLRELIFGEPSNLEEAISDAKDFVEIPSKFEKLTNY